MACERNSCKRNLLVSLFIGALAWILYFVSLTYVQESSRAYFIAALVAVGCMLALTLVDSMMGDD